MRTIFKIISLMMLMILFSCHEVEEQHLNFNQTIWNATKTWFDDNDRVVGSSTSVLEFLTESKGQEIYQDDNGESHSLDFKYRIDGSIIHFVDGLVGVIGLSWSKQINNWFCNLISPIDI